MKKILTLITLTVLLFTGQAFAEDGQQALSKTELVTQGEESSSCSKYAGDWYSFLPEHGEFRRWRVGADGSDFFQSFDVDTMEEYSADKGQLKCTNDIIKISASDDWHYKVKLHTADKLVLHVMLDKFIDATETYTSELKVKELGFEKIVDQGHSYDSLIKYLKTPESQKSCTEELKNSCKNTLQKYINSDDITACDAIADEPRYSGTSCYSNSAKVKQMFKTRGFHFAVKSEMERLGDNANLNHLDTSSVTKMEYLFYNKSQFKGDISDWDVSNVTDMSNMFTRTYDFNSDISKWDVSNVTDMSNMFNHARLFKGDISKWDVSSVTDMSNMFNDTSFNPDISNWDVSNVEKVDNIGNDDLKKLIIAQRQEKELKELKEECKKIKPISTGDICTGVLGLVAVNFKDELKNKQTPDPQKLIQLVELSEYTFGQLASCSKQEPTTEQAKVMTCQLINGDLDHLLLKNLNNKKGAKKVINLSIKQCIDQDMDVANKILAKYGSNPTAEQMLDMSIESGISLSETMHCKKLSEEKPWEYAQEAAKRF